MKNPELERVVNAIAERYARACWWADVEDLRQEAWVAALAAEKKFDPTKGQLSSYAFVIVKRAVAAYLLEETAPVSSSWHERHALVGINREPISPGPGERRRKYQARMGDALSTKPNMWAETLLSNKRWHVRVLARLLELLGTDAEDKLDILTGDKKRIGRPAAWVSNARTRIAKDSKIQEMWKERPTP